ncbi:MAG: lysylphosphatidylglycerol synthase transmembrane domain-containing protein [Byssovorax sp.]
MNVLRAAVFLGAALAFWNTLRHAELGRAAGLITAIGPGVLVVLLPYLVAMGLQTLAYGRIFGILRRDTRFLPLLSVLLSAEAVLMSFPAGVAISDSINPYLLKRRCAMPVPESLAAVAAKKSLIVLANALYMGIALAFGVGYLHAVSPTLLGVPGLEWLVLAATLGLLAGSLGMSKALLSGSIAERSHGLLSRLPSKRLQHWLSHRKSGFLETDRHFEQLFLHERRALLTSVLLLVGMWLVEGTETLVILRLLHVDLPVRQVFSFEVVVTLLRSLAFMIPAGLGVQDAGYVAFLAAFGVPEAATVGVAFVLIKRVKEMFWIAVGFILIALAKESPSSGEATALGQS